MEQQVHPLRRWRKRNEITLEALGERVGVTGSHLSEIERGLSGISFELACKLNQETGLALQDFAREAAE